MFNFTAQPAATTTAAPTMFNPTFTFSPVTTSQPSNLFGTSTTTPLFVFGSGAQNTSGIHPFGNPQISTTRTTAATTGMNQAPPVSQPTNILDSNFLGTTVRFGAVSVQGTFPTVTTASSIFGNNNVATTMTSPFGSTFFKAPVVSTTSTTPNPFNFATTTTTSPLGTNPVNTSTGFFNQNLPTASAATTTLNAFQNATTTAPTTTTMTNPFGTTPINTVGSVFNPTFPVPSTTSTIPNLFHNRTIAATIANSITLAPSKDTVGPSITPAIPFCFAPTAATTTQNQPIVTSSSSTITSQTSSHDQKLEQSLSIVQQQFLAASLLDPYVNRGKKVFTNIDQTEVPKEPTMISTLPTTINTTPISVTIPIQSNIRKTSSSRSPVDVNFKLKPASSLPSLNEDIKPSNQQSIVSTGQMKSTLSGNFTDEEELVLLSRSKMSKLRLSNDVINPSNPIHSLYPVRRLADLEKLTNITTPLSSPTVTKVNEQISRSSTETRDVSPHRDSNPSNIPKQSSYPIVQRKSTYNPENNRLPILTRANYYMKPTISELKTLFNDKGQCIVKQFTVGHEIYGSVTFYGEINVAGLDLDKIIEIKRHEVIVYPDDDNKPAVGEELNRTARITLLGVYPIDRTTRDEITDAERIKAVNYSAHLREVTKKFDGEFINYGIQDGSWTFMVKHFTRYGLDDHSNFIDFH